MIKKNLGKRSFLLFLITAVRMEGGIVVGLMSEKGRTITVGKSSLSRSFAWTLIVITTICKRKKVPNEPGTSNTHFITD